VGQSTEVASDHRIAELFNDLKYAVKAAPVGSVEREKRLRELVSTQRKLRNVDGGYWIAGSTPHAAEHAVTGEVTLADVPRFAVMTDGAARLVDEFAAVQWGTALQELRAVGPDGWIRRVREIEDTDRSLTKWPRYKKSDDAAVVYAEAG
jgi:hypothetical protein